MLQYWTDHLCISFKENAPGPVKIEIRQGGGDCGTSFVGRITSSGTQSIEFESGCVGYVSLIKK